MVKKKHTHYMTVTPSRRQMSTLKLPATDIVLAADVAEVPVYFPSMSFCDDAYLAWKLECEREEEEARERLKAEHLAQKLLRQHVSQTSQCTQTTGCIAHTH